MKNIKRGSYGENKNILHLTIETDDYNSLKNELISNPELYQNIETEDSVFVGYTNLVSLTSILLENGNTEVNVMLEYNGLSAEIDDLKLKLEESNSQVEMLTECLLEMSEIVYG